MLVCGCALSAIHAIPSWVKMDAIDTCIMNALKAQTGLTGKRRGGTHVSITTAL